jgi:hypothetical protein
MAEGTVEKLGRLALWFSPVVIVVAGFLGALRWMKPSPMAAGATSAVVAIVVLAYVGFLGNRESRRWDEVQKASYGFAIVHGWGWGYAATFLLLMVPPVMNWLIERVNAVVNVQGVRPPAIANHIAVQLAFFGGITLLMVMQTLAFVVASFVWQRRMGGEQS